MGALYLEHHGVKGMKWGVRKAYQKSVRKLASSKVAEKVISKSGLNESQKKQALSEIQSIRKENKTKKQDKQQAKESKKERLKKTQTQQRLAEKIVVTAMDKRPEYANEKSASWDKVTKYEEEFDRRYNNLLKMDYDDFMKRYGSR